MVVRSVAIIVCAIWLSMDVGVWVSEARWGEQWKVILFSTSLCVLACLAMGIMWWFLSSTLDDQEDDVWQKLEASAYTPSSGNLFLSTFTVTNGGAIAIDKNHEMSCALKEVVTPGGRWSDNMFATSRTEPFEIEPGGDSESFACLTMNGRTPIFGMGFTHPGGGIDTPVPKCVDVTLKIDYAIVTQPLRSKTKELRFVANENDGYAWHKYPVEMPGSPCQRFYSH
jgi:hypothetical protein